ncbi:MAG: AbrB/MazE/SpoVT family DNA-binding domain-containing protein [Burkholderiales bacterium]|jgi:antitoxin MazE
MESVIRKWGNSPALRLPAAVLKQAGYQLDQKVELTVTQGRIVIEPLQSVRYELGDLLAGLSRANRHDSVDFGPAVGREQF